MSVAIRFDCVSKYFSMRLDRPRSFQERFVGLFQRRPRETGERFWALREASFEIQKGEVVGLIGENGVGKSTALKIMARTLMPSSGRVEINGSLSALLELGTGFHPDLTGRENVFLNGSLHGFGQKVMRRRLDAIISFSELEQFIDVPVRNYSSGMYVRLAFAVAIHLAREILLVDEVLAVGDAAFQRKCHDRIGKLKRDGATIILVSHNLTEVGTLCERAIWLHNGRVRVDDEAMKVVDQYMAYSNERYRQHLAKRVTEEELPEEDVEEEPPIDLQNRWGTQEIEITEVQTLDVSGQPSEVFQTGQSFIIRIHYQVHKPVCEPVFGVAIYHENGMNITGPNTKHSRVEIGTLTGSGVVDFIIDRLPLLAGRYDVSAAVYDNTLTHPYDHHERMYSFLVQAGSLSELLGNFHIPCRWDLKEGIKRSDGKRLHELC